MPDLFIHFLISNHIGLDSEACIQDRKSERALEAPKFFSFRLPHGALFPLGDERGRADEIIYCSWIAKARDSRCLNGYRHSGERPSWRPARYSGLIDNKVAGNGQ